MCTSVTSNKAFFHLNTYWRHMVAHGCWQQLQRIAMVKGQDICKTVGILWSSPLPDISLLGKVGYTRY